MTDPAGVAFGGPGAHAPARAPLPGPHHTTTRGSTVPERVMRIVHASGRGRRADTVDSSERRLGARVDQVLDLARDAFVETNADGVVTEWNRQSEVLFGWSREEAVGRPITAFL